MARNLKGLFKLMELDSITPDKSLLHDLTKFIEEDNLKHQRMPSKTYSPSSMNCIRNMYYKVTGATSYPNNNYGLVGICDSGSSRHESLQRIIYKMGKSGLDIEYVNVGDYIRSRGLTDISIISECEPSKGKFETKLFSNKYNMSFLVDGIIRYKGVYYILEIKTESTFKFNARKGVDDKHLMQAKSYAMVLEIDKVMFLYENRDICLLKPFILEVTQDDKIMVINLIKSCNNYVKIESVPPKPEVSDKICTYCNYAKQCAGE